MPKLPFSIEELALLDAIHDDPRNDRPRLAYADWLETHGLPGFTELIRIQWREPAHDLTAERLFEERYELIFSRSITG
jgi:uncharacterized protein (TIGR02996 family)